MANLADYSRRYNVFDTIRRSARARRLSRKYDALGPSVAAPTVDVPDGTPEQDAYTTSLGVKSGQVGMPTSTFMDPATTFVETPGGQVQQLTPDQVEAGLTINNEVLSPGEAAISQGTPYGLQKYEDTTLGQIGSSLISALDPSPFGVFSSLMGGTMVTDPYGRQTALPGGVLGFVGGMNIEKQYEVAGKIKEGTPGFHQFYQGNNLVSIVPQSVFGYQVGYTTLGTVAGDPQQAIAQYSAMFGFDPASVDLSKRPTEQGFGTPLEGFVRGSGGFNEGGQFVGYNGQVTDLDVGSLEAHIGLVNSIKGPEAAINALTKANISSNVKESMLDAVSRGELTAKQVIDNNGNVVGFETGLGSVVRSKDGIVTSGSGTPVTSGAGIMSYSAFERAQERAEAAASDSGMGMGEGTVPGFTTVSGRDDSGGGDGGGGGGYDPNDSYGSAPNTGDSSDTFFAMGGRVGMQEGGVPPEEVPAGQAPVATKAGFVGAEPEGLPPSETIADDVPMEVPEGTFVLNAAAVEFMGSDDVKTMILEAMEEAEKQGIDIEQDNATIPKEELVSLVVSKGEVIIPPQLAEIIGYDRLNKINNRGKAEVQRRSEEPEQMKEAAPKPPILAKSGGFIAMKEGGDTFTNRQLQEISEDLFGQYKRAAEKPEISKELGAELEKIIKNILNQGLGPDKNVLSETDVSSGSTDKQRNTTESLYGLLTPENAQALYVEMPTLYRLMEGRDDPQAQEALRRMEDQLKLQIGDNIPDQNAPREIKNLTVSDALMAMIKELEAPKQRTVSETPVGGEQGFISKSY